jgi:putative hydrolase of the HAD superfamily
MTAVVNFDARTGRGGRYRALLLDFGGVIQKSFFETRKDIEELLNLRAGSLQWAGPFGLSSDVLWHQVVIGEYSERDYWNQRAREVGKLVGQDWAIRDFCAKHNELPREATLRPEVLQLIADVKHAGLKFGILTNELELFQAKGWLATMPFADQVDCVIDATHTHILKPDPRAYELALTELDLSANEVVFIDDQPRNVSGGEAVGIRSLRLDITNYQACIVEARALMGL